MSFIIIIFFLLILNQAQAQQINFDLVQDFQMDINSLKDEIGARINLGTKSNFPFLRLSSFDQTKDLEYPVISRTTEFPLVFGVEDNEFMEQFRIGPNGKLIAQSLKSSTKRNVVADKDGVIMIDTSQGYSGIINISAFEFVSEWNPGDDHNYIPGTGSIYHESIGASVSAATEILVSQIHLPHQSIIRKIRIYYYDNEADTTLNIRFFLSESANSIPATSYYSDTEIGMTFGADFDTRFVEKDNLLVAVDNAQTRYFIRAWNPNDVTEWGSNQMGIVSVVIYYD